MTAFGRRSKRIRRQALLEFSIGHDVFETIFMISSQLANDAIIGCRFLKEYGFRINFDSETFTYVREGISREQRFAPKSGLAKACSDDRGVIRELTHTKQLDAGQRPRNQSADQATPTFLASAADNCKGPLSHPTACGREATNGTRPGLRIDEGPLNPDRNQEFPDPDATRDQLSPNGECVLASEAACISSPRSRVPACLSASPTCELGVKSVETALLHGQPITKLKSPLPDPRALQAADLSSLARQVTNLSSDEQSELYQVLLRYKDHFTTKPGRCNLFTYEFQVEADKPIIGYSRPIPFALRPAV